MELNESLALVDWDGTIRKNFTIYSWLKFLSKKRVVDSRAMLSISGLLEKYQNKKITHDELAIETALIYAKNIDGLRVDLLHDYAVEFIKHDEDQFVKHSFDFLNLLNKSDFIICVISGAPKEIISLYAGLLPLQKIQSLEVQLSSSNIFVNNIIINPGVSSVKSKIVSEIIKNSKFNNIIALGNSKSDTPLFESAHTNIVVDNPTLSLNDKATFHISSTQGYKGLYELLKEKNLI